jgi:hypothetical protein
MNSGRRTTSSIQADERTAFRKQPHACSLPAKSERRPTRCGSRVRYQRRWHGRSSSASDYRLVRQKEPIKDVTFETEFLDPGVAIFSFNFGWQLSLLFCCQADGLIANNHDDSKEKS